MAGKKDTEKIVAVLLIIMASFWLMILSTNIDYYLGDTIVIGGVAMNWSTMITIMISISALPFVYVYLKSQMKKIKKK